MNYLFARLAAKSIFVQKHCNSRILSANERAYLIYIRHFFSAVLFLLRLSLNCMLNVFHLNWHVYNPGRGNETREDNTERYHKLMQETRPGLNFVFMEESEKEPVLEFQSLVKCDWCNDQVGDTREGWVIGMGRSGKCGR